MHPNKRQKLSHSDDPADDQDTEFQVESGQSGQDDFSASDSDSRDTSDEIVVKKQKSRQTAKRKIRATGATAFGATLQSLLNTDVPSALPLSLKPSIARKRNDEKLESRAKKVLQVEKKEKEDNGRITDVIGGWGGESERALRKVAQRGVVKLFNAIQQSQASASAAAEEKKAARGSGKPTLPAPVISSKKPGKKAKAKDNIVGRGQESAVDKDDFFDMIRSGGIVSKA
ncbi:putative rrp15p [Lyophyllum shimeji]|uniref:Rrp15p n=1 Tax=Lyophyllum shimeji TaxID=47721 RepID=A0A9P3PHK4_LYOSH|nr:putative rrp15p [Lyophyllum shimeji]